VINLGKTYENLFFVFLSYRLFCCVYTLLSVAFAVVATNKDEHNFDLLSLSAISSSTLPCKLSMNVHVYAYSCLYHAYEYIFVRIFIHMHIIIMIIITTTIFILLSSMAPAICDSALWFIWAKVGQR